MNAPTLATFDDLNRGAFRQIVQLYSADVDYVNVRLAQASQWLERSTERRIMPFAGLVQTRIAEGVRSSASSPSQPLAMVSGIAAYLPGGGYGSNAGQVRDFWVDETAPWVPELWAYSGITVDLLYPWATAPVRVNPVAVSGPTVDTGHVQLGPGVVCPPGTQVTITYGGGYGGPGGYPLELVEAVRMETVRQLLVELDPELTPDLKTDTLEHAIDRLLCHWRRRCSCQGRGHR